MGKLTGMAAINAAIRKRDLAHVEISTGKVTLQQPVNALLFERLTEFPEVQSILMGFGVQVEDDAEAPEVDKVATEDAAHESEAGRLGLTREKLMTLLPRLPRGFAEAIAMSVLLEAGDTPPTADDIMALPNADFLKLRKAIERLTAPEGLLPFFVEFLNWLGIEGLEVTDTDLEALANLAA